MNEFKPCSACCNNDNNNNDDDDDNKEMVKQGKPISTNSTVIKGVL